MKHSIEKFPALLISYLFHPLWYPVAGVFLLFQTPTYINYAIPSEYKLKVYILLFFLTVVSPVSTLFILKKLKLIRDKHLALAQERIYPYITTIIYYLSAIYLFQKAGIPAVILYFLLGAVIAVFLAMLINFKTKISAHTTAAGGLVTMLLIVSIRWHIDMSLFIIGGLLVSGLVASARLALQAHTFQQVVLGFLTGIIAMGYSLMVLW